MAIPTPPPAGVLKVKSLSPSAKKAQKRVYTPKPHLTHRPFASLDIKVLSADVSKGIKH